MAVYTYDYDFAYSPAAPTVNIEVAALYSAETISISALIDSGADATMLPSNILTNLNAQPVDVRILRTVTGMRTSVSLYRISIRIGPITLSNIRVVGTNSVEDAIIGRDVLNQLLVTMNGHATSTEIST